MTFLEALYGSQFEELEKKGREGSKARMNGNILLSVMVMLTFFAFLLLGNTVIPGFDEDVTRGFRRIFGLSSGRFAGKLLAIPLVLVIYLVVSVTVGSKENFRSRVDAFMQYPEEEKKKANRKLMTPFFVLLALVFILSVAKL